MAKRFIDTNIFRKSFMRGLQAPHKLLWIYLFCDCSHAGIWEIDFELASLFVGSKITKKDLDIFNDRIIFIDEHKIFIPDFIEFQYGELRANNNAHNAVIRDLNKYKLLDDNLKYNFEGLIRGLYAPMDKDKDKDKDMDKEKDIIEVSSKKSKNCLMKNSPVFDFNIFKQQIDKKYYKYDLEYYHAAILNWSEAKGKTAVDWIATIRGAILRDEKEGKAKMAAIQQSTNPYNEFLKPEYR